MFWIYETFHLHIVNVFTCKPLKTYAFVYKNVFWSSWQETEKQYMRQYLTTAKSPEACGKSFPRDVCPASPAFNHPPRSGILKPINFKASKQKRHLRFTENECKVFPFPTRCAWPEWAAGFLSCGRIRQNGTLSWMETMPCSANRN